MKAVKFFVVFGAVLILVGLGALATRIQERTTRPAHAAASEAEGTLRLEETLILPAGARVTQLAGLDSGAVALVELPQGGGGQMLFFSAQGKLKRRVILTPEVPPSVPRGPGS
ncbi:MAG: hypothetical protein HQL99_16890 [Magnetococcales bacterium]|nr:hypothetical protein [Magnetococcales bacterium]